MVLWVSFTHLKRTKMTSTIFGVSRITYTSRCVFCKKRDHKGLCLANNDNGHTWRLEVAPMRHRHWNDGANQSQNTDEGRRPTKCGLGLTRSRWRVTSFHLGSGAHHHFRWVTVSLRVFEGPKRWPWLAERIWRLIFFFPISLHCHIFKAVVSWVVIGYTDEALKGPLIKVVAQIFETELRLWRPCF